MQLRPYQQDGVSQIINALNQSRKVCYQLPTGGGKTVIISELIRLSKELDVLVLAHRKEIIKQIHSKLQLFGVDAGIIAPWSARTKKKIQVASVQTFVRREPIHFDLVIVDEAHHATASSYMKSFALAGDPYVLGVTATPCRISGQPLNDVFQKLITGPSIKQLQQLGALSKYKLYAPRYDPAASLKKVAGDFKASEAAMAMAQSGTVYGDEVRTWKKLAEGRKTIGFACTIEDAIGLATRFEAAGIPSHVIHSKLNESERDWSLQQFKEGKIKVLWNVDIIGEGFDAPDCDAIILRRPTASLTVFLQQVGRGLRPSPDKEHTIIIDHAANWSRHGMPCDDRTWTLDQPTESGKPTTKNLVRVCRHCGYVNPLKAVVCEECQQELVVKREINNQDASLTEIGSSGTITGSEQLMGRLGESPPDWIIRLKGKTYKDLLWAAKKTGKKPGWAYVMVQKMRYYGINVQVPSYQESQKLIKEIWR